MQLGPGKTGNVRKIRYRSGLTIPFSGIYLVRHKEHRLAHEVTLLKGEKFPVCSRCSNAVQFDLIVGVSDLSLSPFRVVLNQIPVFEEANKSAEAPEKKAG